MVAGHHLVERGRARTWHGREAEERTRQAEEAVGEDDVNQVLSTQKVTLQCMGC